jgi:hypothetical protein
MAHFERSLGEVASPRKEKSLNGLGPLTSDKTKQVRINMKVITLSDD